MNKPHIDTICVQGAYRPKNGEPRVLPIVQSTTYKYESREQMGRLFDLEEPGYFYTRLQNPTNDLVAAKIAQLEGGVGCILTSSGQAASFFSIFNILGAGDHLVRHWNLGGGDEVVGRETVFFQDVRYRLPAQIALKLFVHGHWASASVNGASRLQSPGAGRIRPGLT